MTPVVSLSFGTVHWSLSTVALAASVIWVLGQLLVMAMAWSRRRHCSVWRRWWVLGLNTWVTGVVLLLIAPPQLPDPHVGSVTLITEGATDLPADNTGYRLAGVSLEAAETLPLLHTPGQMLLRQPGTSQVQLVGHGLSAADWATLPSDLTLQWTPPELHGLTDLEWPTVLTVGDELRVSGLLRWDGGQSPLNLSLIDVSGRSVDTQTVLPGERFSLQALPPVVGPVEYAVQVLKDDVLLNSEPIASFVRASEPPRIMIWQSAPSFDTQQLSRWATDTGAQLLVRTQISRDRFLSQRINLSGDIAISLAPSLLATVDMMVLDGRQWLALGSADRSSLLTAVSEGLGLLVLMDAALGQAMVNDPSIGDVFGVALSPDVESPDAESPDIKSPDIKSPDNAAIERSPLQRGQLVTSTPLPPVPVSPWSMTLTGGAQTLTIDDRGEVLEAWRQQGLGRVAVSRLRDRFRWATSGAETAFSRYWSNLLATVARPSVTARLQPLSTPTDLRPFERLQICADNPKQQPLSVNFAALSLSSTSSSSSVPSAPVPLIAPTTGGSVACGFLWTAESGWHALTLLDGEGSAIEQLNVRVWGGDEHQPDRFARRQRATREAIQRSQSISQQRKGDEFAPINPWWLWGALLAGIVPLWLERRLLSGRQSDANVS